MSQEQDKKSLLTAEGKRLLLKERARQLAKTVSEDSTRSTYRELLEFKLAEERYAIEISAVREVIPLRDYTPLPGAPEFIFGLVNVRGEIIPVVNLKRLLGLPERGLSDRNRLVILQSPEIEFGILADLVTGIVAISPDSLQTDIGDFKGMKGEFLTGISPAGTIILNADNLLNPEYLANDE